MRAGLDACVVIPSYNSLGTIGECLCALEKQSYPRDRFEVIVADNGSTDGTQHFVVRNFPEVQVVHAEQKGSGFARNAGISAASAGVILSTDADCVPELNWVERLLEAFREAPSDTGAIGGRIVPFSRTTLVEKYKLTWVSQPDLDRSGMAQYAATPNAAISVKAIQEIGGFDGTLGFDDTDLGIRLTRAGYAVRQTDKAVVRHRNPATLRELYRHKVKYGRFVVALNEKYPEIFGHPSNPGKLKELFVETFSRLTGDILKLPVSVFTHSEEKPVAWPVVDAVIALANYRGYVQAAKHVGSES